MLILVFNESLIKKRKYDVNGVIAVTKTDNLRTYPLTREKIQYNCGDGYICEDIALGLGLLNQSNDNPKKELIKYVAEYAKIKSSGELETQIWNESNGSMNGFHENIKNKYSIDSIKEILKIIGENSQRINGDLWCFNGDKHKKIKFRVKKEVR